METANPFFTLSLLLFGRRRHTVAENAMEEETRHALHARLFDSLDEGHMKRTAPRSFTIRSFISPRLCLIRSPVLTSRPGPPFLPHNPAAPVRTRHENQHA
jgi:hypothetical protein